MADSFAERAAKCEAAFRQVERQVTMRTGKTVGRQPADPPPTGPRPATRHQS